MSAKANSLSVITPSRSQRRLQDGLALIRGDHFSTEVPTVKNGFLYRTSKGILYRGLS
jgi:hypothetical protein